MVKKEAALHSKSPNKSHKPVQALIRGLAMLEALAIQREGLALKELAAVVGISSAAAYHMAQTLVSQGYAERRDLRYSIGPRFAELTLAREQDALTKATDALLIQLARELPGAHIHFSEQVGEDVIVTRHLPSHASSRISTGHRNVLPPYVSGGGLVHLAFWPEDVSAAYKARFPFDLYGLPFWRTRAAYETALAQMQAKGGAFMPEKVPWHLKFAFPLLRSGGALIGAITVQWNHLETTDNLGDLSRRLEQAAADAAKAYTQHSL